MPGRRLIAARVVAGVGAVFWGWLFFGVQDTLTVFIGGQDFAPHYLLESGWGLLFLVLVAVPLLGLVWRPTTAVLIAQICAIGLAVAIGALLAGSARHLLPGAGVLLTALAVAALARTAPLPRPLHVDPLLAVWVLLAAVPAAVYARRMAVATADPEVTVSLDHYPIQAGLGVAVILVGALAAVTRGRPAARLTAATLAVTVGWMGIESVVYPHRQGSFGTTWGRLALAWALVLLALACAPRPVRRPAGSAAHVRSE